MDLTKLSRLASYTLSHKPWIYELEIDNEGIISDYWIGRSRIKVNIMPKLHLFINSRRPSMGVTTMQAKN